MADLFSRAVLRAYVAAMTVVLAVAWPFLAAAQPGWDRADDSPINSGLVVVDGRVVNAPYAIDTDDQGQIRINGVAIAGWVDEPREPEGSQEDRWRFSRFSARRMLERGLERDTVFMIATGGGFVSIRMDQLPVFIEVVDSDAAEADKIKRLESLSPRRAGPDRWAALLGIGVPDPALRARAEGIAREQQAAQERFESRALAQREAEEAGLLFHSISPLLAIGGVLLAVGVLLHTLRSSWSLPVENRAWRHIDPTGQRTRAVL